jgi:hypothetical protein
MLFSSWTMTIIVFNWTVHLFICIHCLLLFECEFPWEVDRKRRTSHVVSSIAWSYTFGLFCVRLCERPALEPESEYVGWTQSLNHHSSFRCNKGPYYCTFGLRWAIYRTADDAYCEAFHIWRFLLSIKKRFQLMNKMLQTMPSYLFWFVRYRCLRSLHSVWWTLLLVCLDCMLM